MGNSFVAQVGNGASIQPDENIMGDLFKQYERVIVESIITSFGLDFLVNDRYGGDVDTLHNVEKIGIDPQMTYKNKSNEYAYQNRGKYNTAEYHGDPRYKDKKKEAKEKKTQERNHIRKPRQKEGSEKTKKAGCKERERTETEL